MVSVTWSVNFQTVLLFYELGLCLSFKYSSTKKLACLEVCFSLACWSVGTIWSWADLSSCLILSHNPYHWIAYKKRLMLWNMRICFSCSPKKNWPSMLLTKFITLSWTFPFPSVCSIPNLISTYRFYLWFGSSFLTIFYVVVHPFNHLGTMNHCVM